MRLFLLYMGISAIEEACLLVQYAMGSDVEMRDITSVWFLVPMLVSVLRLPTVFVAHGRRLVFLDLLQLTAYSFGLAVAADGATLIPLCAALLVANVPLPVLSLWLACRTVVTEVRPIPAVPPLPSVVTIEKPAVLSQDAMPNLLGRAGGSLMAASQARRQRARKIRMP